MSAALLFAATFGVVFCLGIQQLNVDGGHRWFAFFTSPLIALSNLVLLKLMPGPTGTLELLGYLFGGSFGIVASMALHPRLVAWRSRPVAERDADVHALGTELADDVARSDIETYCACERLGRLVWYDLLKNDAADQVLKAERYLQARGLIVRHPMRFNLIRFPPKGATA